MPDIIYEDPSKTYWIAHREPKGYEVYKHDGTHSTRVATIGFAGDVGLQRAKAEILKRLAHDAHDEMTPAGATNAPALASRSGLETDKRIQMKQVRETAAGKAISAYVILRADGTHVATVQAHYAGACMVDVWNIGSDNPTRQRLDAAQDYGPQQFRATGYGYDKFTHALAGAEIDGHKLTDHCGSSLPKPEDAPGFPRDFQPPPGYRTANWQRESETWGDCYRLEGLKYLEAIGYRVIQAI